MATSEHELTAVEYIALANKDVLLNTHKDNTIVKITLTTDNCVCVHFVNNEAELISICDIHGKILVKFGKSEIPNLLAKAKLIKEKQNDK